MDQRKASQATASSEPPPPAATTAAPIGSATPVLVFFSDQRSGRSRRAEGFLAQVLQRRRNHKTFRLHYVEVGERPDLAQRFQVETTPTLIVIEAKRARGRLEAPRGCRAIESFLEPWLK
jgi:thioredoxin-like negative regulator of GroEL